MRFAKVDTATTTNTYSNIPGYGWYVSAKAVPFTQFMTGSNSENKALEFTDITSSTTSETIPAGREKQTRDSASMAPGMIFGYREDVQTLSDAVIRKFERADPEEPAISQWESRCATLYKKAGGEVGSPGDQLLQRLIGYSDNRQRYFLIDGEDWKAAVPINSP